MSNLFAYRTNLIALSSAFVEGTGIALTTASRFAARDTNFFRSLLTSDRIVREKVYSRVTARLSALWPDGLEWPSDIERPAPVVVEPYMLARVRESFENKKQNLPPDWPKGVAWPSDVPKPVDHQSI